MLNSKESEIDGGGHPGTECPISSIEKEIDEPVPDSSVEAKIGAVTTTSSPSSIDRGGTRLQSDQHETTLNAKVSKRGKD